MKVKSIYICEICNTKHTAKTRAENCEAKCKETKEKEKQSKVIEEKEADKHFNAKSIAEIAKNISEYLTKNTEIECVASFDVNPDKLCRNFHSAPKGKRVNFSRENSMPTGYMGLFGRFSIHIKGGYNGKVYDCFNAYRNKYNICTGTGGARPHGLEWSVTIWADDYPNIKKQLEEYYILHDGNLEYEEELMIIECEYNQNKRIFVKSHETYENQLEIIKKAQENLQEIDKNLQEKFICANPISQPKAKEITWDDVSTAKEFFKMKHTDTHLNHV
jgi:hypothetical protein